MTRSVAVRIFRLTSAAVLLVVLAVNQINNIRIGSEYAPNYLFLFTIQGNLLLALWFCLAGLFPGRGTDHSEFRGALMVYGLVLSGVYWGIIAPRMSDVDPVHWRLNIVLHSWCALSPFLDCLLTGSCRPIRPAAPLVWLVFPLVYLAVTMLRGGVTGWYPYPFLDPRWMGSVPALMAVITVLLLIFAATGYLILLANRLMLKTGKKRSPVVSLTTQH